ncbi:MAG: NADH-quinone oxidoreductase, chain, partial [Frankiales bacterium]|nr:NADH-quinone oxidoreductase, chain [Frankiales bacterium]
IDAGAVPTLLPGGRPVGEGADVAAVWGELPSTPGRDLDAILTAARDGELSALVVGSVDPADCPDPWLALDALDKVPFLVSLELRRSPVTDRADVVLPVAAAVEKAGTFLDWEGRARPFERVLDKTGLMTDGRVLHTIADELDRPIDLPDVQTTRYEIARLGAAPSSAAVVAHDAVESAAPEAGQAVLASWHWLLDDGSLQDGEPHLAGTAKKPRLHLSAATAAALGVVDGDPVTVSTDRGSLTLPLVVADLPDGVVWVPTRTAAAHVRTDLAAAHGSAVRLSKGTS